MCNKYFRCDADFPGEKKVQRMGFRIRTVSGGIIAVKCVPFFFSPVVTIATMKNITFSLSYCLLEREKENSTVFFQTNLRSESQNAGKNETIILWTNAFPRRLNLNALKWLSLQCKCYTRTSVTKKKRWSTLFSTFARRTLAKIWLRPFTVA